MKKFAFVVIFGLIFAPLGFTYMSPDDSESVSNNISTTSSVQAAAVLLPTGTVAAKAIAGQTAGKLIMVTDGNAADDCTTGTGSTAVVCVSNGSTWVAL